jgi:cytochrome c peroxidase
VPPYYLDQLMHDLRLERFTPEPGDGPIKTFTLRGIKDSPPYLHDGTAFTLEDTVEFFNLVFGLRLSADEKKDLVAFLRVALAPGPQARPPRGVEYATFEWGNKSSTSPAERPGPTRSGRRRSPWL